VADQRRAVGKAGKSGKSVSICVMQRSASSICCLGTHLPCELRETVDFFLE
jgi:hypothetical protein